MTGQYILCVLHHLEVYLQALLCCSCTTQRWLCATSQANMYVQKAIDFLIILHRNLYVAVLK